MDVVLDQCHSKSHVYVNSYDRARILEEYRLKRSSTVFVDTISLHMSLNGMSGGQVCVGSLVGWGCGVFTQYRVSLQRNMWRKLKKEAHESGQDSDEKWVGMTSMNSLQDVYSLYCNADLAKVLQTFVYVHVGEH